MSIKLLTLDVETGPDYSAHFPRRNIGYIPMEHTVQTGGVITWAAKWHHEKDVISRKIRGENLRALMSPLYKLLDEADCVISFNGRKFDIKKINTEFVRLGLSPPSPVHHVDLYREVARQFAFPSHRLKDVLKELGLDLKLENEGMQLWIDCTWHNKKEAWEEMLKYNRQDVVSTEKLYDYLHARGWVQQHPNAALWMDPEYDKDGNVLLRCNGCGSTDLRFKGYKRTTVLGYKQYLCNNCGRYPRERTADQAYRRRKDVLR